MSVFLYYFGVPDGAVYGNIVAEPIIIALTFLCLWLFRDRIGRPLAAWAHKHYTAHLASLSMDSGGSEGGSGAGACDG